jgi:hypothetical protein
MKKKKEFLADIPDHPDLKRELSSDDSIKFLY